MKSAREVVKALKAEGFAEVTQGATSHKKMRHADGRWTVVTMHPGEMPYSLLKKMEKQTRVNLT